LPWLEKALHLRAGKPHLLPKALKTKTNSGQGAAISLGSHSRQVGLASYLKYALRAYGVSVKRGRIANRAPSRDLSNFAFRQSPAPFGLCETVFSLVEMGLAKKGRVPCFSISRSGTSCGFCKSEPAPFNIQKFLDGLSSTNKNRASVPGNPTY
jgi:hypothetical protein